MCDDYTRCYWSVTHGFVYTGRCVWLWGGTDTRRSVLEAVEQLRGVCPHDCRPSLVARALVGSVTNSTRSVRKLASYGRLKALMSKSEVQGLIKCVALRRLARLVCRRRDLAGAHDDRPCSLVAPVK